MRGKDTRDIRALVDDRITPAYAGKSCELRALLTAIWDHPRICGEKLRGCKLCYTIVGSPPHMRGKARRHGMTIGQFGITPAYAGKREALQSDGPQSADHPRICGEKKEKWLKPLPKAGSPPHMRGKVFFANATINPVGITPAYAGKRYHDWAEPTWIGDHPRICGEKTKKIP